MAITKEETFDQELKIHIDLYELNKRSSTPLTLSSCLTNLHSFSKFLCHYIFPYNNLPNEFIVQECKKYPLFNKLYLQYILIFFDRYDEKILKPIIENTSYKDLADIFYKIELLPRIVNVEYDYDIKKANILKQLDQWIDINAFIKYNVRRPYILTLLLCINKNWINDKQYWETIVKYLVDNPLKNHIQSLLPKDYRVKLNSLALLKKLK